MSNLTTANSGQSSVVALTAKETGAVIEQVKAIQHIMAAVMKDGTHYGVIPGCKQPSLYKPGSEALLSAFKISVEPEVEEIRDGDHITFKVRCVGRHMASGVVVGIGVGEASTAEDKYAWRAAVCLEEFNATPESRKREKWNKGYQGAPAYSVQQVRTNVADIANTVLKMAKKRAQIDLCLTALAASDIFTQDIEDLPEEYRDGMEGEPAPKKNRYQAKEKGSTSGGSNANAGRPATEGQVKLLKAKLANNGKNEADLLAQFKVSKIEEITMGQVNDAIVWIDAK